MLTLFLPETVVCVSIFLFLCFAIAKKQASESLIEKTALISGFLLLASCAMTLFKSGSLFFDTYRIDSLSQGFKLLVAISYVLTIFLSKEWDAICKKRRLEFLIFLNAAILGMLMIPSSVDLLTLFVSLELSAYSLYLLASLRQTKITSESSVKYLLFGAATSGVSLWGLSLIIGLSGTTSLALISKNIASLSLEPVFTVAVFLFSLSLFFKLSSFPMHFWAPDVYENSSLPVTGFIATASKASAIAILIRVFYWIGVSDSLALILGVLAFLSMTLGNAVALVQKDVKRLLAYSSIAQAGYIVLGLMAGTPDAFSSSYFYAFAYLVMNAGAFLVITFVAKNLQKDNPVLSDFDGLAEKSPFLSLILLLSLLSLAGIPPLIGFTGKWILFAGAMQKGYGFLVLWAVLNSVVSLFYYLNLVKHAYLYKPTAKEIIQLPKHIGFLGLLIFVTLVAVGFFPGPFIHFAENAIRTSVGGF